MTQFELYSNDAPVATFENIVDAKDVKDYFSEKYDDCEFTINEVD